jgi:Flp pilus assembly protein protease CpaA
MPTFDPQMQPGLDLLARVALTVWLLACALSDIRTGKIPNWMTLPVMLAAGAYQTFVGRHWAIPLIWIALFIVWELNFMMAGDAKVLMGLFALFPTLEFALVLAVGGLIELIPLLMLRYARQPITNTFWSFALRVQNREFLPTREDLVRDGKRMAWVFCFPAIAYVWWFW